jgi:hypothetical protein
MLMCWVAPAVAQQATGAAATKDCPVETVALGQVVTCTFTFENIGVFQAVVTTMTETRPSGAVTVTCIPLEGPDPVTVGGTLFPNDPCTVTFDFTIPNDPSLCGTFIEDSAEFEIYYENLDLTAGAFATHVVEVACEVPPTTTTTAPPTTTTTTFVPVTSPTPSTPTPTPTQNTLPVTGSSTGLAFFAISLIFAGTLIIRRSCHT